MEQINDLVLRKRVRNKLKSLKKNAEKRNIEFNLTWQDVLPLLQKNHCELSGAFLTDFDGTKSRPSDRSIDRIDNNKGYVPGNIIVTCRFVNCLKNQLFEGDSNFFDIGMLEQFARKMRYYSSGATRKRRHAARWKGKKR